LLDIYNEDGYDLIFIIYAILIFTVSSHDLNGHTPYQSSYIFESLT